MHIFFLLANSILIKATRTRKQIKRGEKGKTKKKFKLNFVIILHVCTAFTIHNGIIITINIKIYEIAYYLIKIKIRYQVSWGEIKI